MQTSLQESPPALRRSRPLARAALLFVVDNLLSDDWCSMTFHTFAAAHRDDYQALVVGCSCRTPGRDLPSGATRFPRSVSAHRVQVSVNASRDGVLLEHRASGQEPVDAFIAHLRLVADVFKHTEVAVRLVARDTTRTTELLRTWLARLCTMTAGEASPPTITGFVGEFCGRDLSSLLCAPAVSVVGETQEGSGAPVCASISTLLTRAESVELLGDRTGDAMLRGVERLASLRVFCAANQNLVQTLRPLAQLNELSHVDVRGTSISDPDIKVLGRLPHLVHLHVEACVMLTNLNPLEQSRSLKHLSAGQCRQLLYVGRLGDAGQPLRSLDLSENHLVSTAQLTAVLSAARQDLLLLNLNGMRLPQHIVRQSLRAASVPLVHVDQPVLGHVTALYLSGAHLPPTAPWLEAAPCLQTVYLDRTNVTELHLEAFTRTWRSLQVLSLVHCLLLRTTLAFALPLTSTLTMIHISEHSLVPHHVVAQLEQKCVFVQRGA